MPHQTVTDLMGNNFWLRRGRGVVFNVHNVRPLVTLKQLSVGQTYFLCEPYKFWDRKMWLDTFSVCNKRLLCLVDDDKHALAASSRSCRFNWLKLNGECKFQAEMGFESTAIFWPLTLDEVAAFKGAAKLNIIDRLCKKQLSEVDNW